MQNIESMRAAIREVVAKVAKQSVADDQPIVSSGIIDSLAILTLISEIEKRLAIRIPKEKVQPDDFDCVDNILDTLDRVLAK